MDVELSWQTFACTGDILCYLDYRRQLAQLVRYNHLSQRWEIWAISAICPQMD